MDLPVSGTVLVSVRDEDKMRVLEALRLLDEVGFRMCATSGTAAFLTENGIRAESVKRATEGSPNTAELIAQGEIDLVVTTTRIGDPAAVRDSASMRRAAIEHAVPYFTTVAGARAAAEAIRALRNGEGGAVALQDLYPV
jgi:carbamoyl-phosphate synthase large subunit